jgi:hypothetical protein
MSIIYIIYIYVCKLASWVQLLYNKPLGGSIPHPWYLLMYIYIICVCWDTVSSACVWIYFCMCLGYACCVFWKLGSALHVCIIYGSAEVLAMGGHMLATYNAGKMACPIWKRTTKLSDLLRQSFMEALVVIWILYVLQWFLAMSNDMLLFGKRRSLLVHQDVVFDRQAHVLSCPIRQDVYLIG